MIQALFYCSFIAHATTSARIALKRKNGRVFLPFFASYKKDRPSKTVNSFLRALTETTLRKMSQPVLENNPERDSCLTNIFLKDAVTVRVTELTQCFRFNLANAFARNVENLANLFQRFHTSII